MWGEFPTCRRMPSGEWRNDQLDLPESCNAIEQGRALYEATGLRPRRGSLHAEVLEASQGVLHGGSNVGIARIMNPSGRSTMKAISPWAGLWSTVSGGGEPAPGEKGFLIGSMAEVIRDYTKLYKVWAITGYQSTGPRGRLALPGRLSIISTLRAKNRCFE